MYQGKIEHMAVNDIIVRHCDLPGKETAARKFSIFLKGDGPQIHVYRNQDGQLLLTKGIDAYNALMVIDPERLVPVFVMNNKITEMEWTFQLLHSCFSENVHFKIKYEYVLLLLKETKGDIKKICDTVGCTTEDILKYKIDERIPDQYKELAFRHKRQKLVNDICRNPKLTRYRTLLYKATFETSNRLTQEKLKILQEYIDMGHSINLNSADALKQLNKIVDKKGAFETYWGDLFKNDPSFTREPTFIRKMNKKNKGIWIKLE